MRIQVSDTSREMSTWGWCCPTHNNGYQKLTLRNYTSKKRNFRYELSIKELKDVILNE